MALPLSLANQCAVSTCITIQRKSKHENELIHKENISNLKHTTQVTRGSSQRWLTIVVTSYLLFRADIYNDKLMRTFGKACLSAPVNSAHPLPLETVDTLTC